MAKLKISEFTDPGCPFAWSAEPARRRLSWLYGDQLNWQSIMVGLADSPAVYEDNGFTPERQSGSFRKLAGEHHMPIDTSLRPRMAATVPACRAVVAVRRHRPDREPAILRWLRVLHFAGRLLDEPETIDDAARRSAIDPQDLHRWLSEAETEQLLRADLDCSRTPMASAVALSHKLAPAGGGYRYTCPSYEIERLSDGVRMAVPGFQPVAAYEVAIANLCPEASRRPEPQTVEEALAWAGEPLATVEVAVLCQVELAEARERLGRSASEAHVGSDGLWRPNDSPA